MPGIPSARGCEWRGRGGDPQRYEKELARIFKAKPAKCLSCSYCEGNDNGDFCTKNGNMALSSVTGKPPAWCPLENGDIK
jgi:hypothetical protein